MADVTLAAEVGRPTGSRATRRLRREGKIPGVIYGHGTDPVPVAVVARELRIALNGEAGPTSSSRSRRAPPPTWPWPARCSATRSPRR
jgi:ribosomal protein L25 (general stress protein Ctc)